jgi:hypothetical protein
MINDQITDAVTQLLQVVGAVGLFRYFIYAIGEPHAEYNPKAILAGYSAFVAHFRGVDLNIDTKIIYEKSGSKEQQILNKEASMSYAVDRIKHVAGWGNAVGFCPTCTSFWFMAIFVLLPTGSIAWFGASLLLSKIVIKWT